MVASFNSEFNGCGVVIGKEMCNKYKMTEITETEETETEETETEETETEETETEGLCLDELMREPGRGDQDLQ